MQPHTRTFTSAMQCVLLCLAGCLLFPSAHGRPLPYQDASTVMLMPIVGAAPAVARMVQRRQLQTSSTLPVGLQQWASTMATREEQTWLAKIAPGSMLPAGHATPTTHAATETETAATTHPAAAASTAATAATHTAAAAVASSSPSEQQHQHQHQHNGRALLQVLPSLAAYYARATPDQQAQLAKVAPAVTAPPSPTALPTLAQVLGTANRRRLA